MHDKSIAINGCNDYLELPDRDWNFNTGDFTMSFHVPNIFSLIPIRYWSLAAKMNLIHELKKVNRRIY